MFSSPFQLGAISNVLAHEEFIENLVQEMVHAVPWVRRKTDFYHIGQSSDLVSISTPRIVEFYDFLKTDMMDWMRQVTGLDLTHVSANCSMYNYGDYLLPHDDCISDRKIAFVFYLSPWPGKTSWTPEMGGALELFEVPEGSTKPEFPTVRNIAPKNNQIVFFKVCDRSFHQVGEVLNMDYPRLTINGWFHGPGKDFEAQVRPNTILENLSPPNNIAFDLTEWVNATYLREGVMANIQEEIEEESQISLREFLIPDFVDLVAQQLSSNALKWVRPYSVIEKNYETLVWESASGPLRDLGNLFASPEFFDLLRKYTDLDFSGENASNPKCFLELQRWTNGCYTMMVNETKENYVGNVLDVILYLRTASGMGSSSGSFVYVNQEQDPENSDDEGDNIMLTVEPERNSLNMIYCTEGITKFGKYVSKAVDMQDSFVYILCCTYRE